MRHTRPLRITIFGGITILTILIILSIEIKLCNPKELSNLEATEIATLYYKEKYGKDVTVSACELRKTGEKRSQNFITVSVDGSNYEMVLDEKNHPLADDMICQLAIYNIDLNKWHQELNTKDLFCPCPEHFRLSIAYHPSLRAYQLTLSATLMQPLQPADSEKLYTVLQDAKSKGVNILIVQIVSDHNLSGIQIAATSWSTNASKSEFYEGLTRLE